MEARAGHGAMRRCARLRAYEAITRTAVERIEKVLPFFSRM